MTGILYIASEIRFLMDSRWVADESTVKQNTAQILVYQSVSGRTGFDADPAAEALVYALLARARICSPTGAVVPFSEGRDSFEADVLSFLSKGGPDPVTFVGSGIELDRMLTDFTEYSAALRRNALRIRYGKSEERLTEPELAKLFATNRHQYYEALETLYKLCERVMVWSFGGGFGMHVICLAKDHASYQTEILGRWAEDYNSVLDFTTDRAHLPAW